MYPYAPHAFQKDDVLDVRRLNDTFLDLSTTIGGGLDETAWDSTFITADTYCDLGMFGRYWVTQDETDPNNATGALEFTKAWAATAFAVTVDSRGGTLVIEASCQVQNAEASPATGEVNGSIVFAIRVDGAVQGSSILGTGDFGADKQTDKSGVKYEIDANGIAEPKYYGGTGPAIRAVQTPIATGCVVKLPPGRHTIELVYRNPIFGTEIDQFVMNGEIYAIELPA